MPKEGQYLLEVQDGVGVHHPLEEGVEMVHEDVFCGCEGGGGVQSHTDTRRCTSSYTHTHTHRRIYTLMRVKERRADSHTYTPITRNRNRERINAS